MEEAALAVVSRGFVRGGSSGVSDQGKYSYLSQSTQSRRVS